jgi:hypothetical protein
MRDEEHLWSALRPFGVYPTDAPALDGDPQPIKNAISERGKSISRVNLTHSLSGAHNSLCQTFNYPTQRCAA